MQKIFKVAKDKINLPIVVIATSVVIFIYYIFSYLVPFTGHAFLVTNVTPIAADVSGFITEINVENGSVVKKDDPLFTVYQPPYQLAYDSAKAKYEEAIAHVKVIELQTEKTRALLNVAKFEYERAEYEYKLKNVQSVEQALSKLEVKELHYNLQALENTMDSFKKQIAVEDQQIVQQKKLVEVLKAQMENAQVDLDLTVVKAPADGVIDNLYIGVGTPIKAREPLFSFIDTSKWWVQANFNETDLRNVRVGDKATIILRTYYFDKIFHGKVVNTMWAADRKMTDPRTQQQKINPTNQWLLEPQRFPVQIEISDPDPKYPFNPGASAYVYIHTQ